MKKVTMAPKTRLVASASASASPSSPTNQPHQRHRSLTRPRTVAAQVLTREQGTKVLSLSMGAYLPDKLKDPLYWVLFLPTESLDLKGKVINAFLRCGRDLYLTDYPDECELRRTDAYSRSVAQYTKDVIRERQKAIQEAEHKNDPVNKERPFAGGINRTSRRLVGIRDAPFVIIDSLLNDNSVVGIIKKQVWVLILALASQSFSDMLFPFHSVVCPEHLRVRLALVETSKARMMGVPCPLTDTIPDRHLDLLTNAQAAYGYGYTHPH